MRTRSGQIGLFTVQCSYERKKKENKKDVHLLLAAGKGGGRFQCGLYIVFEGSAFNS